MSCNLVGTIARVLTVSVKKIVNKFISELENRLKEKNISLEVSNDVKDYLVRKGYSEIYGARPIERLIQLRIKEPIADYLLKNGNIKSKIFIKITLNKEDKLEFIFLTEKIKEKVI